MRKSTKIWLIVASVLTLLGALIFACAMATENWDFTKLSSVKYETKSYEISEYFKNVSVDTTTANITILPTDEPVCRVECYEQTGIIHTVKVVDETLEIITTDSREWHDYIDINFDTPTITLYLPEANYVTVSANTNTGDINVENIAPSILSCVVTTGRITAKNVTCTGSAIFKVLTGNTFVENLRCNVFFSNGNTGDITVKNVIAEEEFEIYRSTGDVRFTACDAAEISIETGTGDVTGTWLTPKTFDAKTSTGEVDVPSNTTGEKCSIKTSTGDIKISIEK